MRNFNLTIVFVLFAAASLLAQQSDKTRATAFLAGGFRAPILAESEGIWAAGPSYKASFHDGFTYYPVLGREEPNDLPLRWRTSSVTAGDRELVGRDEAPEHSFTDWRYEYRYGAVTEAYDVRKEGVEQTFVFVNRPRTGGDIVVRGRFETELEAKPVENRHAALRFFDRKGREVVEYGAATVVDARGDNHPLLTTFDGREVTLTVPGSWLASAEFPIVIDPLTTTKFSILFGGTIDRVRLAREDVSSSHNVLLTFDRTTSSSGWDSYAYLMNDDFSNATLVFRRTGAGSTRMEEVAFASGAGRWVWSFTLVAGTQRLRSTYLHDRANLTVNSGWPIVVPTSYGSAIGTATMGAQVSGHRALLAFVNYAWTSSSRRRWTVWGAVLDAKNRRFERFVRLAEFDAPQSQTCRLGCNSAALNDADGWFVGSVLGGEYASSFEISGQRVYSNGATTMRERLDAGSNTPGRGYVDAPLVAGFGGRYMVACRVRRDRIRVRRTDWPAGRTQPTVGSLRTFAHYTHTRWQDHDTSALAFDTVTRSHWVLTFRDLSRTRWFHQVVRLGHTGGAVERRRIYHPDLREVSSAGVAFRRRGSEFQIVWYGPFGNVTGFQGTALTHTPGVGSFTFGTGCGTALPWGRTPYAGLQDWYTGLRFGPSNATAILAISTRKANLAIGGGCFLQVDPTTMLTVPVRLGNLGTTSLKFDLPDYPRALIGDVYLQWAYADKAVFKTTRGLWVNIRP